MIARAFGRMLLAAICVLVAYALVVTSNPRAEPKPDVPPNAVLGGLDGVFYERCPGAQRAITYYRRAYTWQRAQMNLTGAVPRRWYDCTVTLRRAVEWRGKFRLARTARFKWLRDEYADPPEPLLSIAKCETGGINGGRPLWTHHNGSYSGAYGFAHSTWAQFKEPEFPSPAAAATPRQQTVVAQKLVARFGGYSSWPACHRRLGLG